MVCILPCHSSLVAHLAACCTADRAKKIVTEPVVNVFRETEEVRSLQAEVTR